MQKNTVRLYEQGASWKYWMRWLVWAFGVGCLSAGATPFTINLPDNGSSLARIFYCNGATPSCQKTSATSQFITTDKNTPLNGWPVWFALPDNDPSGALFPAAVYSYAKAGTFAASIPPTVTCPSATTTSRTYSTTVSLPDPGSCNLSVTPQSNGDPYAGIKLTGTLSRTGNLYNLANVDVCGGPYSACAPAAVSAPIDPIYPKSLQTFSAERKVK